MANQVEKSYQAAVAENFNLSILFLLLNLVCGAVV